ncbi:hypothetical protein MJ575_05370 [Klebsiella pneumoniae]|nr:hypothetical protein MJ575_05370 [Klebsiella pneumoniae]
MFPAITPPPSMVPGRTAPIRRSICRPLGEQFTDSCVKGFGYSLGDTTQALFSSIDWDDDDHHHHIDDYRHGDYSHNGDNININVNNFNHITGEKTCRETTLTGSTITYRGHTVSRYYGSSALPSDQRFRRTERDQHAPVDRERSAGRRWASAA